MAMTKRTPEFVKRYDEEKIGREVVEGKLAEISEDPENTERAAMLAALENPHRLREFGRTVRVSAIIDRSERTDQALEDFTVRWVVSETHHSYILSSGLSGTKESDFGFPFGPACAIHWHAHRNILHRLRR